MPKILSALAVSTGLFGFVAASAQDVCSITALHEVSAMENPAIIMHVGDHEGSITGYQIDRGTLVASFCQHGGACWPETVIVGGRSVSAVRLTNCLIDRQHPKADAGTVSYALLADRGKVGQQVIR